MAVTEFGKILRKIRIDHDEILLDMSDKLGVSGAYLSAVENGKRKVPTKWIEDLSEIYDLSLNEINQLRRAAHDQATSVRINLEKSSSEDKEIAFAFARRMDSLDDETREQLKAIFLKKGKKS